MRGAGVEQLLGGGGVGQAHAQGARGGLGLAVLPLYVAHDSVRNGSVQVLLKDWLLPAQEMHAVYPSPRLVPTKVHLIVSWLQGQFGEAWWTRAP
jgi:DNA-binding transcriptional LysR family regulator